MATNNYFKELPLWIQIAWSAGVAMSFSIGIVMMWVIVEIIRYVIGLV
jgi:hypothetical protein